MGKLQSLGLHLFKYLLCSFLIILSILFLILTIANDLSSGPVSSYSVVLITINLSLYLEIPIFVPVTIIKVVDILGQSDKVRHYVAKKHLPEIRISIKTRLEIRPYVLLLSVSVFLIFLTTFIGSFKSLNLPLQFSPIRLFLFITSYVSAILLFILAHSIYSQEEKAIFLLDRFFRSGPKMKDLERALKSYQKTLPAFYKMTHLKEIVRRTRLVLSRGTDEEVTKIRRYALSLCNAIREDDSPLFDRLLTDMNNFLLTVETQKSDIIQMVSSRKELLQGSFKRVFSESLKEIFVAFIVIILLIILYFVGIRIPFP